MACSGCQMRRGLLKDAATNVKNGQYAEARANLAKVGRSMATDAVRIVRQASTLGRIVR
jgi:hypothetical protein